MNHHGLSFPSQFSKLVGFDITPDSGTTLRKMLKHNFTPFLEQMESISAGASKVSHCHFSPLPPFFHVYNYTGVLSREGYAKNGG